MHIKQRDIFWNMNRECIRAILEKGKKQTFARNDILFSEGDPADRFYSLVKGCVRLNIGGNARTVYIVSHAGEAFGWSSLISRDAFTATAVVSAPSTLMVFDSNSLLEVLAMYPEDGMVFFRQLARTLATRLIQSYEMISGSLTKEGFASIGSGQMAEPAEV